MADGVKDPIRYLILTQLKAKLEEITVANGYRTDVAMVEIAARSFDDPAVSPATMPWIGIIPQTEKLVDESFNYHKSEWPIDILSHFEVAERTLLAVAKSCEYMTSDIRKALYETQDLGIDGVIMVQIVDRMGSEGAQEAAQQGRASVQMKAVVQFEEGTDSD